MTLSNLFRQILRHIDPALPLLKFLTKLCPIAKYYDDQVFESIGNPSEHGTIEVCKRSQRMLYDKRTAYTGD